MNLFNYLVRGSRYLKFKISKPYWYIKTVILLKAFNVNYKNDFVTNGVPYINITNGGYFQIGNNFRMNNGSTANLIGRQQKCIFIARHGKLILGNNIGISSSAIICHNNITIGNNVRIGGNVVIYDTDFHSVEMEHRSSLKEDLSSVKTRPVYIDDNVFIGAHTTILKGVTIGYNSIIGAGSVVTSDVPPNQIWGGNPAKFLKNN